MVRDRKRLVGAVRSAVRDYGMIEAGDRIAVGVSGGKDSLAMLYALSRLRACDPMRFDLVAVTLDLGLAPVDFTAVAEFCRSLDVPYRLEPTKIGRIVFETRKEESPCSLCSTLRRGALHRVALELGCNRVALGHTREDAAETLLMGLFYEGRLHCFAPVQPLSRTGLTLIRPLVLCREREIRAVAEDLAFPVVKSPCPATGTTSRRRVEDLVARLEEDDPYVGDRVFRALLGSGLDGWKRPGSR